jgi:hypothetical protein
MSAITLPVSLGEALDKLTILDIKLRRIKDGRRNAVQHEYDLLHEKLGEYIDKYKFYYGLLVRINEQIWDDQDIIRGVKADDRTYAQLCNKILDCNDMRFRIKNKINQLSDSSIKEQKGYALKKAFFVSHMGMGDVINQIGAIRYYSLVYDELVVFIKEEYLHNIQLFIGNDPNIKYTPYKQIEGFSYEHLKEVAKLNGADLLAAGQWKGDYNAQVGIPLSFYTDLGLSHNIYRDYFYVPDYIEQKQLLDLIRAQTARIAFIHLNASNRKITYDAPFDDDVFYCDPCESRYQPGHKFYELSKAVLGHPIIMYKSIIEAAEEIYVIDSSFSCFAGLLALTATKKTMMMCMQINNGYSLGKGVMEGFKIVTRNY